MSKKPRKKLITNTQVTVSTAPALTELIDDALSIIGSELSAYSKKTKSGRTLELKEARAVQGYMDSLIKMSKESRETKESIRKQELSKLTDEQLLELANEAYSIEESQTEESQNAESDDESL